MGKDRKGISLKARRLVAPIKEVYMSGSQRYLLKSYLTVLFLSNAIIFAAMILEIMIVRKETYNSNLSKTEHSVQLLENNIETLETLVSQCVSMNSIKILSTYDSAEGDSIFKFQDGLRSFSAILNYQSTRLIKRAYLYYNKSDYIFFNEALYLKNIFQQYLNEWQISENDWSISLTSPDIIQKQYVLSENGSLHLVMPINVTAGKNNGTLVFLLDESQIRNFFSFAEEYGECAICITDDNGNIIISKDADEQWLLYFTQGEHARTLPGVSRHRILSVKSEKTNWNYYIVLPAIVMVDRLLILCIGAGVVMVLTFLLGIWLSMGQSIKMGRPIDKIYAMLGTDEKKFSNLEHLGEIVGNTVNSNLELRKELEESRPQLRKAFFHDLITLDVTNSSEMDYLAENAGINRNGRFRVVSVGLFTNNDFYGGDEQTLQDIRVILTNMQHYMEAFICENLQFYQRNWLSMLILFDEESIECDNHGVEMTWQWLRETFATESSWGISRVCDDIINLWRYCEEAETARKYCRTDQHIQEYSVSFEDARQCYFPEVAREKLENSIRSGDVKGVSSIIELLKNENVVNRRLGRNSLIKLNSRFINVLDDFAETIPAAIEMIMELNGLVLNPVDFSIEAYFLRLEDGCIDLCKAVKKEKSIQRKQLSDDIRHYIEANYQNPNMGLAKISVVFKISEGYISTLFKEQTNINFAEYVENFRLSEACRLLKESNKNIGEIASAVGYNSLHSFRRAFKRVYNMNPKDYR